MAIFYLDGTTLTNSSAVYDDADLTTCAADGFYSDGVVSREQVNCSLLPEQVCITCAVPCGDTITGSGEQGIYKLDLFTGDSSNDVGAIIITLDPYDVPDGVRATYNGVVYNKVSSPVDGYHASPNTGAFIVVGNTSDDCGLATGGFSGNLVEKEYVNGQGFVDTGQSVFVSIDATDVSLTPNQSPGAVVMVIPKTSPTPAMINIEFVGPCSGTGFAVEANCPVLLTGYQSSDKPQINADGACSELLEVQMYNAPVTGTSGVPNIHDWIFIDAYGSQIASDGFYHIENNNWIEVQNGVVVQKGACDPT